MLRADAIVVLGCRIAPSGRPGPAAVRRVATAASAYLAGVAPRVVVSGGRRWGSQIEARAMRGVLEDAGVPSGAIVEELCSLSTYENAVFSAAVLRRLGAQRAAVVTCPWHMARALANFRAAGVDAAPIPAARVEAPLSRRLYLHAHEVVCSWLDARAMRRADVLARAAAQGEWAAS
ncbi:MAG: YdcF family protein [Minicystis sp.]